jgi:hypothetical protein
VASATLVQILLPLHDDGGQPHPPASFLRVRQELTRLFGGLNAYSRGPVQAPVAGADGDGLIVYEVLAERLESGWWHAYRSELERRFHQRHIEVRAQAVEVL